MELRCLYLVTRGRRTYLLSFYCAIFLSSPIAIIFLASLVAIPWVLPLMFVKLQSEPYTLSKTSYTNSVENST